jgi:lysophospholipase L1-like esterase
MRIYGATLTPFQGAGYYTDAGEQTRQQVNAFLRSNTVFDGTIDFDKAVADPTHPGQLLPKYDRGDHLHPSDLGYAAMAAAVHLKDLRRPHK